MDFRAVRRWLPLAGVVGLLAAAAWAASRSSLHISRVEPVMDAPDLEFADALPTIPTVEATHTASDGNASALPSWIGTVLRAGCLLGVAALVGFLLSSVIRYRLRYRAAARASAARSKVTSRTGTTGEEVVAALDAGLADLSDTDADPRRAVIACWVRLEQVAAAAGTPRQIGDTSTDLVTRLLTRHGGDAGTAGFTGEQSGVGERTGVSADVLAAFAEVYRQARYATHTVDERMRAQARAALERLRAELTPEVRA